MRTLVVYSRMALRMMEVKKMMSGFWMEPRQKVMARAPVP